MKNKILIGIVGLIFMSCAWAGIGLKPVTQCVVDMPDGSQMSLIDFCLTPDRDSSICKLGKWEVGVPGDENYQAQGFDPCVIHRGLEIVSKEGLVLEGYTSTQFEIEMNRMIDRVNSGMTLGDIKYMFADFMLKFNRAAGAQILILSDMFLELPQNEFIKPDDKVLVISSLKDLITEVNRLATWIE